MIDPIDGNDAMKTLSELADWCATERAKIDAYDPRSSEEYGLRRVEIELRRLATAQPQAAWEWQSMDVAPKDREIIGLESDGRIFNLRWEPDDCGENWYDVHGDQLAYPTCWASMPYFVLKSSGKPGVEGVESMQEKSP